jgi:hypothetical protein
LLLLLLLLLVLHPIGVPLLPLLLLLHPTPVCQDSLLSVGMSVLEQHLSHWQ